MLTLILGEIDETAGQALQTATDHGQLGLLCFAGHLTYKSL